LESESAPRVPQSSDELGREFGISGSAIERVRSIMEHRTPEQIESMRGGPGSKKPVSAMYEQVQNERIKKELASSSSGTAAPELRESNRTLHVSERRLSV
jgi:hypothetical protein